MIAALVELATELGPEALRMLVELVRLAVSGALKATVAREAEKLAIRIAFDKAVRKAREAGQ